MQACVCFRDREPRQFDAIVGITHLGAVIDDDLGCVPRYSGLAERWIWVNSIGRLTALSKHEDRKRGDTREVDDCVNDRARSRPPPMPDETESDSEH